MKIKKNMTNKTLVTRKTIANKLKTKPFVIGLLKKKYLKITFNNFSNKNFLRRLKKKTKKTYFNKFLFKKKYRLGLYIENRKYRKKKKLFTLKAKKKPLLTKRYNSFVFFNKQQFVQITVLYSVYKKKKDNCNLEVFLW